MVRTVYIDLLFLINFSMDFLCFFLVSRLFGRPLRIGRTLLASALGGVYAVLSIFFSIGNGILFLADCVACAVMCGIAIARRGMKSLVLFREILVYTGVSMALGGVMTAVYNALNQLGVKDLLSDGGDGPSAWLLLLLAAIGGGATLFGSRFFRREGEKRYAAVTVGLLGRSHTFSATVDTGNALSDPISGAPAAIVDRVAVGALFPGVDGALLLEPTRLLDALPEEYRTRFRLLPAKTVTGEGMLVAFRPDFCTVSTAADGEGTRTLILAISPTTLADAEMLLPPGIL